MNKKSRLAIANAFRLAKQRLARNSEELFAPGASRYICYALADVTLPWGVLNNASNVVCDRIRPYAFLEDWLNAKIPDYDCLEYEERRDNVQAYRHRWLDALIEEFSK